MSGVKTKFVRGGQGARAMGVETSERRGGGAVVSLCSVHFFLALTGRAT